LRKKEVEIGGLAVRYYEDGDGPPLLLLHGAGGTARLWHRQAGPLSKSYRVVAPDLPGFGGTAAFPWIKSIRDYAGFIAKFMDALGIRRASVAGSSLGGWAACWFAVDYPGMLDRLVLISPAGLYFEEAPPMPLPLLIKEVERYYASADTGSDAGLRPSADMERGLATIRTLESEGAFKPDLSGVLSEIKVKTLIIWGAEDKVIPASYADKFRRLIPGSEVRLVEGAGHMPFIERHEVVNELISSFLASPGA